MRLLLLVILLGFPVLELVVLVRLWEALGWWVLAWVALSACAGMALIKEARFAMVARLASGLAQGEFSGSSRTSLPSRFFCFRDRALSLTRPRAARAGAPLSRAISAALAESIA
jgi:hypothetical protein